MERLHKLLAGQILAGLCFNLCEDCTEEDNISELSRLSLKANELSSEIIRRLPQIRSVLATDVTAAFNGDPAADSYAEIISCYPVIKALTNYRVAHELYELGVPLIPRMMTEMAHSETGIDIHPGATIGEYFTIDHGTGVVIGATCIIGKSCIVGANVWVTKDMKPKTKKYKKEKIDKLDIEFNNGTGI